MKKRVELHTTITPINSDKKVKPTAPIWRIENAGAVGLYIDNFYLFPGQEFGINCTPVIAKLLAKEVDVESDTEFTINFRNDMPAHFHREAVLIQTFVKIISE